MKKIRTTKKYYDEYDESGSIVTIVKLTHEEVSEFQTAKDTLTGMDFLESDIIERIFKTSKNPCRVSGGPGQWFTSLPYMRLTDNNNVMVKTFFGRDC